MFFVPRNLFLGGYDLGPCKKWYFKHSKQIFFSPMQHDSITALEVQNGISFKEPAVGVMDHRGALFSCYIFFLD